MSKRKRPKLTVVPPSGAEPSEPAGPKAPPPAAAPPGETAYAVLAAVIGVQQAEDRLRDVLVKYLTGCLDSLTIAEMFKLGRLHMGQQQRLKVLLRCATMVERVERRRLRRQGKAAI